MAGPNSWAASAKARTERAESRFRGYMSAHWPDYSLGDFVWRGATVKGSISCKIHGPFMARPSDLTSGYGCRRCGLARASALRRNSVAKTLDNFRAAHGDRYDYSAITHAPPNNRAKVTVICREHGPFEIKVIGHQNGKGCRACAGKQSGAERQLVEFVRGLGVEVINGSRRIIPPLELDLYMPAHNLAIEFCGLYWHSDLAGKPADYHRQKLLMCRAAGIRLLTIYEDEWDNRRDAVAAIIRRAIGILEPSIGARRCELVRGAAGLGEFYDRNHVQGMSKASSAHYALLEAGDIVAAMSFRLSARPELTRFATSKRVPGAASRLLLAFIRDHNPTEIVSFSDDRYFTGEMYAGLGFVLDRELPPDYRAIINKRSFHKFGFRRKMLPRRLREIGSRDAFDPATDPRSEAQVCRENGIGRIYDCGKKRWLWRPAGPCRQEQNPNIS